ITVSVGSGLTLTGDPSTNPTISITNTGVQAGDYSGLVVNARGQITSIPSNFAPVSAIESTSLEVFRTGNTVTIDVNEGSPTERGIVALSDSSSPLDPGDNETAVTPAAVLAAISSSNTGTQATATSTGEADSLYTNILSSSALQLSLPSGKRAIVMAECMVLDGAAPATPVAYCLAIFSLNNVKLYSNKID